MSGQYSMFDLMTFGASHRSISSPGSADGPMLSASPDGPTTAPSGPAPRRASLSAPPENSSAATTPVTSPPILSAWSGPPAPACCLASRSPARKYSERLQRALERRLEAGLSGRGSTIYRTGWKHHTTPLGRRISRLRASALRISAKELSSARSILAGWTTASATDGERGGTGITEGMNGSSLTQMAPLAGWPTASARDWKDSPGMAIEGKNPDGSTRLRLDQLPRVATLSGWPTPKARDHHTEGQGQFSPSLPKVAESLAGWPTPTAALADKGVRSHEGAIREAMRSHGPDLAAMAALAGPARLTISGELLTGSFAGMASGGQLNPEHSRWLMGFLRAWASCHPKFNDWQRWQDFMQAISALQKATGSRAFADTETQSTPTPPLPSSANSAPHSGI